MGGFKVQKVPRSHQKKRVNNEAIRWEGNRKEKVLKNMEMVKIVERVFK